MAVVAVSQSSSPSTTTTTTTTNLEKIESFLNDPLYKEILENSVNYNTRLCIERRLRLPFIDTQTGVAQNHSALFVNKRERMPGLLPGQIYTYPRQRWRKKRRQYLTMNSRAFARAADAMLDGEVDMHSISTIENPALHDTDSKDSQLLKDEVSKEWFYDDPDILEMDPYDEPDQDSDLDYEESYSKRKRGKRGAGRVRGRAGNDSPSTPGRKKGGGRGRKKATTVGGHSLEPTPGDPDKPFACELCGVRYKTRPGLTYHYRHSCKEAASDENSRDGSATPKAAAGPPAQQQQQPAPAVAAPGFPPTSPTAAATAAAGGPPPPPSVEATAATPPPPLPQAPGQVYQDSYVSFLNQSPGPGTGPPVPRPPSGPPQPTSAPIAPSRPVAGAPGRRGRQPPGGLAPMPPMGLPQAGAGGPQPPPQAPPNLPPNLPPQQQQAGVMAEDPPMPVLLPEKGIEPPQAQQPGVSDMVYRHVEGMGEKKQVTANPYCDFCLGDSSQNKKTGAMEELVSCSDCGRSGHPTCLQFTDNMKVSVKKYRWQCIECKNCSVCGTSDNDDQLLFCDDCDRGYHMYCLSPPLVNPPEGSWSCKLCLAEFHRP